jgi:hypothetical protein
MPFSESASRSLRNGIRSPWLLAAISFLVGAVIGLVFLGWVVWPVQYIDTTPDMLRSDIQVDYLRMVVDSYGVNGQANLARSRFDKLGTRKWDAMETLRQDDLVDPAKLKVFDILIANSVVLSPAVEKTPSLPVKGSTSTSLLAVLVVLGVLIVGAGTMVLAANILRHRKTVQLQTPPQEEESPSLEAEEAKAEEESQSQPSEEAAVEDSNEPLERFVTSYEIGNDVYEDSFTINSPSGEFLGECGVGISEPIGVGGQKKVTAFEVWLFDRKPSRTSTIVLMSDYAFHKEDLRTTLAPRGKPVLAEPGSDFWLETPGLQVRVVIRELRYGRGPLPQNSFFEGMTLQMEVWSRASKPT